MTSSSRCGWAVGGMEDDKGLGARGYTGLRLLGQEGLFQCGRACAACKRCAMNKIVWHHPHQVGFGGGVERKKVNGKEVTVWTPSEKVRTVRW